MRADISWWKMKRLRVVWLALLAIQVCIGESEYPTDCTPKVGYNWINYYIVYHDNQCHDIF